MLATENTTQERMETLKSISNTLDKVESVEIPQGSTEDTISFLLGLFKGTDEQFTDQARNQ